MAQKDAFLCAENNVKLNIAFQKRLGAGFFGGEGFIVEELSGRGTVMIHACGDFVEMDLKPGQTIKVDTGSVVGWDASVSYDIQRAGNIKTSLFGGEGIFLTALTGPGHIILQSMTLANLALGATSVIGDCNSLDLRTGPSSLSLTIVATYNAAAALGLRVHVRTSPDDANWDNEDWDVWTAGFTAGATLRETENYVTDPMFLRVLIENLDPAQAITNIAVIASVGV